MLRKLLIITTLIASTALTGCASNGETSEKKPEESGFKLADISLPEWSIPGVYRIPIRQGNLVTQEMVNDLKPGMTKRQVRYLLGTPLLVDTFHDNRWDYLYRHKPGSKGLLDNAETEQNRLQVHFKSDRLVKIVGDIYPQGEALAKATKEKNRERTILIPADAPRYDEEAGFFDNLWKTVTFADDDEPVRREPDTSTEAEKKAEQAGKVAEPQQPDN